MAHLHALIKVLFHVGLRHFEVLLYLSLVDDIMIRMCTGIGKDKSWWPSHSGCPRAGLLASHNQASNLTDPNQFSLDGYLCKYYGDYECLEQNLFYYSS